VAAALQIGVLALQGDFAEHAAMLRSIGASVSEVRTAEQMDSVQSLIIPGGESTSMAKLMDAYGLRAPLRDFATSGKAIWGTCAGLILLAERLIENRPEPLGVLRITVQRNGFGRQVDSFESDLSIKGIDDGPFHAVFIRAPIICQIGSGVEELDTLDDGTLVAARQDNLLVTAFHPELTADTRLHRLFMEMSAAPV